MRESTEHILAYRLELGFQTAVVYIDFAKAFDTVSHKRLFVELHAYGTFLSWLLNFSDRTHQTKINSSLSEPENLLSGVIQGSGIGAHYVCYVHQ